jgi:hypothetical protein
MPLHDVKVAYGALSVQQGIIGLHFFSAAVNSEGTTVKLSYHILKLK